MATLCLFASPSNSFSIIFLKTQASHHHLSSHPQYHDRLAIWGYASQLFLRWWPLLGRCKTETTQLTSSERSDKSHQVRRIWKYSKWSFICNYKLKKKKREGINPVHCVFMCKCIMHSKCLQISNGLLLLLI